MLITFEGIDGSGKTTQIQLLKEFLEQKNKEVVVFREPGGNQTSEKIRSLLLDEANLIQPVTELLLFSAARAQLVADQVKPKLDEGFIVILDRFYDSTTAYQGYGRKAASLESIHQLNEFASLGLVPKRTIYLRVSLEEAERRRAGTSKDRMEQSGVAFYKAVIDGFDDLAKKNTRFLTIQAELSIAEIQNKIREQISTDLGI